MAYRRIIQLSPTTKVISLPSSWLSRNRVKKGDSVNVEESGNRIIIETLRPASKSMTADLTSLEDDHLLWTAVDSFYMLGYSHIELKLNANQKRLMTKVIKYFPMLIISSETKMTVELDAVSGSLEMDFDKTIQHVRHMTNNMFDEALNMIYRKDWASLSRIKKMDYDLNIYVSMCFRHLNSGKIDNAISWAQFVKLMELYADRICMLFMIISKSATVSKNDIIMLRKIRELYDGLFRLLNKFDIGAVNKHFSEEKSLELLFDKSHLKDSFYELTRSIQDMREIIFQLRGC
ncbi:MAG: AbrB/MazE/SpoVT family DNA-binding domain-containing protein [Candidatus Woesearchaeota archaeon]